MRWTLKFLFFWLLLSTRILSATAPMPKNKETFPKDFALLDNTASIKLVPHYNPALSRHADFNFSAHLLNPCEPFIQDENANQKPILKVNEHWLNSGKKKITSLQKRIDALQLPNAEQQWFTEHAIPRLTFSWSLFELANSTQYVSREYWYFSRKHQISHSLIRTLAFQAIDLNLTIQYLNKTAVIAEKPIKQMHVLLLSTNAGGFIPLLIFNPPQHLIEARATSLETILHFWGELVWNPNVICCDPEQRFIFSPYLLPNAFMLKNIASIGILPVISEFTPPPHFSNRTKNLFQAEWNKFLTHCNQFIKNEPSPTPPPLKLTTRNEL